MENKDGLCKVTCPKCGFEIDSGGMEESNGWKGLRPNMNPKHRSTGSVEKESQDMTWPELKKHDQVRVPEVKGREIGTIEKVYLDKSLDVKFPSEEKATFVDSKGKNSVQRIGLRVGDKFGQGFEVEALHINEDVGVYAATIVHEDGKKEAVVLENVEEIRRK